METETNGVAAAQKQAFYAGVERFVDSYFASNPVAATEAGMHRHDGRLADVPRVLADAEANLGVCPRRWVEIAVESATGGLSLFQHLIPALARGVAASDPVLGARLEATNAKATAAVGRYLGFLQ